MTLHRIPCGLYALVLTLTVCDLPNIFQSTVEVMLFVDNVKDLDFYLVAAIYAENSNY